MYHSQLIEKTNNEPVNTEHLHGRDIRTVLSFSNWLVREVVNWCCHTVVRGLFSNQHLLLGSEAFIGSALGCRCPGVSPHSGLSNLFHLLLATAILEEGTTIERRPSGFGSDEFVWKYLSKDMLNGVDRSKERWHLEYACVCHVLHTTPLPCVPHPPKICGENFCGTVQIRKICESFLPQKFPAIRYLHAF